jgi:hypothetical protein
LTGGELLPLAISLNLLADRLMHMEQADKRPCLVFFAACHVQ